VFENDLAPIKVDGKEAHTKSAFDLCRAGRAVRKDFHVAGQERGGVWRRINEEVGKKVEN
jgi:hypothetical protein